MKHYLKKNALLNLVIALFTLICICFITLGVSKVFAVDSLNLRFESTIKNITDKKIENVKVLKDFDNNNYTLFEMDDTGYFIFNNNTSELLEWGVDAKSPYLSKTENLYYAGLQSYYYKSQNYYYDVTTDRILTNEEIAILTETSKRIQKSSEKVKNEIQVRATPGANNKYVSQYNIFTNMTSRCGYAIDPDDNTGLCGYIALAMILDYYYVQDTTSWIKNSNYIELFNGKYVPTKELTLELRRIGKYECGYSDSGTTSVSIKKVATNYASKVGLSIQKTDITFFISYSSIRDHIINNRPVILFGSFTNPSSGEKGNHAVVCYGTYDYGIGAKGYITHFGYQDYSSSGNRYNGIGISTGLSDAQLGSIFSMWRA